MRSENTILISPKRLFILVCKGYAGKCLKLTLLLFFHLCLIVPIHAREYAGVNPGKQASYKTQAAGCAPASSQTDLDINNVRTTILGGGDMWWDPGLTTAKYEIPKGSGKHSLFAGALWIGGVDAGGSLKIAAMTYRQTGNDFFPGPLNKYASISSAECLTYDHHYKITRQEVEDFVNGGYVNPSAAITNWPAFKDGQSLAPFYDGKGDGKYTPNDPQAEDYPYYRLPNQRPVPSGACPTCEGTLFGDQTLWWVFNDAGNIHTQTSAQPIGLEVQAQAFAFSTNDEINNMTFYQYKIINKSSFKVNDTYFGQWVDPDLGNPNDDYVGCDVGRGLGYCYNGDADDEGANGYGVNPPAIGIDFFQGPIADMNDGIDNNRNGVIDEDACEQIIMSKFVYYNNDASVRGEPFTASDHYNYLKGMWKDGTPMTYGGIGYNTGVPCNFMFPDKTDPANPTSWTEDNSGNTPADRRFLQSAGKFTLDAGAINYITVGAVWARASQGGNLASINLMKAADDKAQSLFNNCFKILDGPNAPDLSIREMDKYLILSIDNLPGSNNYLEAYSEVDPTIIGSSNNQYKFQGYQIFQLKDNTVNASDVHNPDKARLVAQCDIADNESQLVNYYYDPVLNANIPVEEVNGANKGIVHTFVVKQDKFAVGNTDLINHKSYYFTVIAYSFNRYAPYNSSNPDTLIYGQKRPYVAGRRNVKVYSGIPHSPSPENNGQNLYAIYGSGPKIQRVEGEGNGGMVLDFTPETIAEIITSSTYQSLNPVYENGRGPINIKVFDPVKVPKGLFQLIIDSVNTAVSTKSKWKLINITNKDKMTKEDTVYSQQTIAINNEQIIAKWGLTVNIAQVKNPGVDVLNGNGFLEATQVFTDPTHPWLTGLEDAEGDSYLNWIRSGKYTNRGDGNTIFYNVYSDYNYLLDSLTNKVSGSGLDDNENYEHILGGTWAPFRLCSKYKHGPARSSVALTNLSDLASVDVVLTPDKSKWSRCPVVEMNDDPALTEGGAAKFNLRKHASVNKEGVAESGTGMGWFPGYAINVETGERLNIMFGEDSWMISENGNDMKWNPTSNITSPFGTPLFGGKHYIYVMGNNNTSKYDEGSYLYTNLSAGFVSIVYRNAMWVSIPLLAKNETLLSNEVKIRLRVSKTYKQYNTSLSPINNNNPVYTFNTNDIAVQKNNADAAKRAMDLINVVPNPYYAYSAYEKNQLDSRIKITNLPVKCTVSIYTVNGTLVRRFNRDLSKNPDTSDGAPISDNNIETSIEWDLKNTSGIPIASGLYLIHIDAGAVGEKLIKWVGVMRPIDLDTF